MKVFSNKRYWTRCLLGFVLLSAAACGDGASEEEVAVVVGDEFRVGVGETAVLTNGALTITFDSVLEDSRCPTNVDCFWEGQARVLVQVKLDEAEAMALEFNTNSAPDMNQQSLTAGEYVVALQSLAPYPQEPDTPIEPEDYVATLLVTKP